jgi:hypothetical protein
LLQIYKFVVTTQFLTNPLQKKTILVYPTPRMIFDFVQFGLPFPTACMTWLLLLVSIGICMCDHNV